MATDEWTPSTLKEYLDSKFEGLSEDIREDRAETRENTSRLDRLQGARESVKDAVSRTVAFASLACSIAVAVSKFIHL